jgi:hypothetical protein
MERNFQYKLVISYTEWQVHASSVLSDTVDIGHRQDDVGKTDCNEHTRKIWCPAEFDHGLYFVFPSRASFDAKKHF